MDRQRRTMVKGEETHKAWKLYIFNLGLIIWEKTPWSVDFGSNQSQKRRQQTHRCRDKKVTNVIGTMIAGTWNVWLQCTQMCCFGLSKLEQDDKRIAHQSSAWMSEATKVYNSAKTVNKQTESDIIWIRQWNHWSDVARLPGVRTEPDSV